MVTKSSKCPILVPIIDTFLFVEFAITNQLSSFERDSLLHKPFYKRSLSFTNRDCFVRSTARFYSHKQDTSIPLGLR
jgi:hypothetical protein